MAATEYAIRYYRDNFWAEKWRELGVCKPAGWRLSPHRYQKRIDAEKCAQHINQQGPEYPVEVVALVNGIERG